MTVYFIGAGPGAPDLLTVRAARLVARCGTCLYAGSIVPREVIGTCPPTARVRDTARMPLHEIVTELRDADARGDDVARLHSGDPGLYSAIDEQIRELDRLGIAWEIVPGVPSFAAAAARLGAELTVPRVSQSLVLTRVDGRSSPMPEGEDLATVCASGATAVIHLAAAQMERVVRELTPVYGADCPAAVVAFASRPDEVIVRGRLDELAGLTATAGVTRTAVVVVGRVLGRRGPTGASDEDLRSFLYSDDRPRDAEGRTLCAGATPDDPDATTRSERTVTPDSTVPPESPSPESAGRPDREPETTPGPPAVPPGRILLLGGTAEARRLADLLDSAGLDVVTSLAGRVSRPALPRGEVRIGGFGGPEGLARWLTDEGASAVIDATHPFAERISASAVRACAETGVPLLRLHRPGWSPEPGDDWIRVASTEEAAEVVRRRFRRPMLTIGRQGLAAFAGDTRGSYLIRCVEPPEVSLPHRYLLVLDRGPFGVESERALMSRHRIDVLVTKNSGGTATHAKLEAARALHIPVVMIERPAAPDVETVHTVPDAARWLVERFGSARP